MSRVNVIKPDSRENKTTIQISREIKEALTKLGLKNETYNTIIDRLISEFRLRHQQIQNTLDEKESKPSNQIQIGENITFSKYDRVTISIKEHLYPKSLIGGPLITLEVSYNKPIKNDDSLYQIDLKINKVIFNNEIYSPKEFFGVLQKDVVYCEEFLHFYFTSLLEILRIEFKKSNYFFKEYSDYYDLSRWRTFLLNTKLSPEILSSDVESILSDMKNKKTNKKLLEDVGNSYYKKLKQYISEYDA